MNERYGHNDETYDLALAQHPGSFIRLRPNRAAERFKVEQIEIRNLLSLEESQAYDIYDYAEDFLLILIREIRWSCISLLHRFIGSVPIQRVNFSDFITTLRWSSLNSPMGCS